MAEALFPQGVKWEGTVKDGMFVVDDIVDNGISELKLTGRKPSLAVPLTRIAESGGKVIDRKG